MTSDKVMVMSRGEVIEFDTPQNLVNERRSQFNQYLSEVGKESQKQSQPVE